MSTSVLRTPGDGLSLRIHRRAAVVCGILTVSIVLIGLASICLSGDLPFGTVVSTLSGHGTRGDEFLVYTLRAPRVCCAALVGLALGASGALFQNLLRNPLGSPDVVGFSMGSSVGAVVAITFFQASMVGITLGSLIGALATSGCVYALAYRNGAQSYRLILVGVGVSLTLSAFVNYLLARVNLGQALTAQIWLTGSLNGRGWNEVVPTAIALVVLLPLSCGTARSLGLLEMGDGVARALGVRVEQTRLAVLLLAVALVAIATAAAGPISFVALAAPQVARRLTRFSGVGVLAAAQVGAVVVLVADWIAQNLFPTELPVGVATGAVGGVYLAWLLSREWRRT